MGNVRHRYSRPPWWRENIQLLAAVCVLGGGGLYLYAEDTKALPRVNMLGADRKSCNIKGNISDRGERIYHVPGQRYYDATIISPAKGERWFCSQWEAWWAGWRKSKV